MKTIAVDDEFWMLKRFELESQNVSAIELKATFRSPLKALEYAGEHPVDLAFLDMEMPEMTGLVLAEKLRAVRPAVKIIFISAYDQYIPQAMISGLADYYLLKPYEGKDLEAAVGRMALLRDEKGTAKE